MEVFQAEGRWCQTGAWILRKTWRACSLVNVWVRKASSAVLCMGRKLTPRGRDLGALERTRSWMEVRGRHHFECVAILFLYWSLDPEPPAYFLDTCAKPWGGNWTRRWKITALFIPKWEQQKLLHYWLKRTGCLFGPFKNFEEGTTLMT